MLICFAKEEHFIDIMMLMVALLCQLTVSFYIVVHLSDHVSGDWEIQRDGVLDH